MGLKRGRTPGPIQRCGKRIDSGIIIVCSKFYQEMKIRPFCAFRQTLIISGFASTGTPLHTCRGKTQCPDCAAFRGQLSALWLDFSFAQDSSCGVSDEPIAITPFRFQAGAVDCCLGDPCHASRLGFLTLGSGYLAAVPAENVYLFKQMIPVLLRRACSRLPSLRLGGIISECRVVVQHCVLPFFSFFFFLGTI